MPYCKDAYVPAVRNSMSSVHTLSFFLFLIPSYTQCCKVVSHASTTNKKHSERRLCCEGRPFVPVECRQTQTFDTLNSNFVATSVHGAINDPSVADTMRLLSPPRLKRIFSIRLSSLGRLLYLVIVLALAAILLASCVFLLSQAVRTSPNRSWARNVNAVVIGAAYVLVVRSSAYSTASASAS